MNTRNQKAAQIARRTNKKNTCWIKRTQIRYNINKIIRVTAKNRPLADCLWGPPKNEGPKPNLL
jgi:hypothetical protein